MDITLLRTFLEVAATGTFAAASERLFVTQSAVSLRIQRLEETLGQPLFTRSKAGAEMTPAGREFESYAQSMLKLWEEARQQVAIPEGFSHSLVVGAQYSLWPRLGFRWMDAMQAAMPGLALRAELGMPDRLTRFLVEGVIQCALTYTPQVRPGLEIEEVLQEELILVASWPEPTLDMEGRYIFVDWGPEFTQAHAIGLPGLKNTGMTLSLGALAADYIIHRRAAGYLPARYAQHLIDAGRLHLVPDAPRFQNPVWAVWRGNLPQAIRDMGQKCLTSVAQDLAETQGELLQNLSELSGNGCVETLGSPLVVN